MELVQKDGKYYFLGDVGTLEYYTVKDNLKVIKQRERRRKKRALELEKKAQGKPCT